MSKYYKEVDLDAFIPRKKILKAKPPAPPFPTIAKFHKAIKKVRGEIMGMQVGNSDLVHYSLYFKDGRCPATVGLDEFEVRPNEKSLVRFLKLARQDFGARAEQVFTDWFYEVYPQLLEALKRHGNL